MKTLSPRARTRAKFAAPVTLREMALDDLTAVFDLGVRLFTPEKWPTMYRAWDEREVLNLFSDDSRFCIVAESGNTIVGFALGTIMKKPRNAWSYGWVLWLGVSRRVKRRGVGSRLMKRLTSAFIEAGARMLIVDTDDGNQDAIALFRRLGFADEMRHVYLSRNLLDHPKYMERANGRN